MLNFLELVLCIAALLTLMPVVVLLVESLAAAGARVVVNQPVSPRPRVAVLVPAHNEELLIADTLATILSQLGTADRIVVVADNCSDSTASIAMAGGAEVIVRTDASYRGKGYALDFGVRHLEWDPPDIVVIVDGDCRVDAGAIDVLASLSARTGRPAQALYLMEAGVPTPGLKQRVAQFAWLVKNQVRPLGMLKFGLPCQLMGTGMAFPWECLKNASLASGHIVEDMKLGVDLARSGTPAIFCPNARVTSSFPASDEGVAGQRTRWEHGHLSVILDEVPRLLFTSSLRRRMDGIALAMDLMIPPLSLLMTLVAAIWCASAVFYATTARLLPVAITSGTGVFLMMAVAVAWASHGRQTISLRELVSAPFYALWKIPLYIRYFTARQTDWVRSRREKPGA